MGGEKLDLVKRTTAFMLQHLSAQDKLGVVEYDSDVNELLRLARTDNAYKAEAERIVNGMVDGSCTNLSGGLLKGIQQQQENRYLDWSLAEIPAKPEGGDVTHSDDSAPGDGDHLATDPGNAAPPAPAPAPPLPNLANNASGDFEEAMAQAQAALDVDLLGPEQAVEENEESEEEQVQQGPGGPAPVPSGAPNAMLPMAPPLPPSQVAGSNAAPKPGLFGRIGQFFTGGGSGASNSNATAAGGKSTKARQGSRGPRFRGPVVQQQRMFVPGRRGQGAVPTLFNGARAPEPREVERDALRSVFLFTDGLANEGITDTTRLVQTVRKVLDNSPRVRVYTFGFGADHNPDMLRQLADAGSGIYYYVENQERIPIAFADALGGLLDVSAQNVELRFAPAPGVRVEATHTAYATAEHGAGGVRVSVGDMFGEEAKDVLFEAELPALGAPAEEFEVGTLTIEYLDVAGGRFATASCRCVVARPEAVPNDQLPEVAVSAQRARIETAQAMEEATALAGQGKLGEARDRISAAVARVSAVREQAAAADSPAGAMVGAFEKDLQDALVNMRDPSEYQRKGSKWMASKAQGHLQQRSVGLAEDFGEAEACGAAPGAPSPSPAAFTYASKKQQKTKAQAFRMFSK